MPISFAVASTAPTRARGDLLVVPVFADAEFGPGCEDVDTAAGGALRAFMGKASFEGKRGSALLVPIDGAAKVALLVGLGSQADLSVDDVRTAAALISQRSERSGRVVTTLAEVTPTGADRTMVVQAIVEGVILGGYEYLTYKSKPAKPSQLASVVLLGVGGVAVKRAIDRGRAIAGATCWARDMVNTPARELSPAGFAKAAQRLLQGRGVRVEVLDVAAMRRERLGGVLGVGQGSKQPPRFVKMTYAPRGSRGSIALVGKGVVFDSGGLSIKTGSGMETMKTDMAGAAAVIATMSVLAELGVTTKVVGYTPMVENMPSGEAIRPGDVLTFRNGKTAEVLNTDAEGRLILADALSLAAEKKPDLIIDLATLTGACMVALGDKIAGVMANDDAVREQVLAAAHRAGEPMWALPLPRQYRKLIDSEIADMKNIGSGGYGGALTAGLFLEEFVAGVPWAHLDIAGPARASADDGYTRRGASGFGVRSVIELVSNHKGGAQRR